MKARWLLQRRPKYYLSKRPVTLLPLMVHVIFNNTHLQLLHLVEGKVYFKDSFKINSYCFSTRNTTSGSNLNAPVNLSMKTFNQASNQVLKEARKINKMRSNPASTVSNKKEN